ncbi:flagellin [Parasulfuritortus cantonensis]|uniref:Flagellin n=1 Tax=Parasulfuritortus cantonensis TaxID=2528202 RepID=A0A4V2NWM7_9PROT|nr:flagellin [Parasulfuritortus cantonensis]TCJ17952.1 flagellin [Parasulfuritortus cantonensis]
MAYGDISLTASMRNVLVSLQQNSTLLDRTSERLSTGKKVNSALDNPASFFAAKSHTDRASQLDGRKDSIGEAIQTIKAADSGVTAITTLIETARGLLSQARSTTDTTALNNLASQYTEVLSQIDNIATDSNYKGINLLNSDTLSVAFNEDNSTNITISGFDATSTGLSIGTATDSTAIDTSAEIDTLETSLNDALTSLRTNSAGLASNLAILSARDSFITSLNNVLTEGATKLTAADTNEEGANMLILQTRQQLGTTALSIASQAAQSVLRLF